MAGTSPAMTTTEKKIEICPGGEEQISAISSPTRSSGTWWSPSS
jgi:hypothetical protein